MAFGLPNLPTEMCAGSLVSGCSRQLCFSPNALDFQKGVGHSVVQKTQLTGLVLHVDIPGYFGPLVGAWDAIGAADRTSWDPESDFKLSSGFGDLLREPFECFGATLVYFLLCSFPRCFCNCFLS